MKKSVLSFITMLVIQGVSFAQTAFPNYQDGKIWFKINDEYHDAASPVPSNAGGSAVNNSLPFEVLPFVENLSTKYKLTRLTKPFAAAINSSVLQRTYLLEFSDHGKTLEILRALQSTNGVDYAELVPLDKKCLTPNDPGFGSQWGLSKINAQGAWDYFSAGSTISVAIVDDAVERTHGDLSGSLWVNTAEIAGNNIDDDNNGYKDDINGFDVADNDNNPNPPSNQFDHGTHVAGIAGAKSNNSAGVASIGYSIRLMCVKSTNSSSAITNGYDGIVYAAVNRAKVINLSWGGTTSSTTAQNIIDYAYGQGCIIIAAAGNNGDNVQFYPSAYNNVISVANTKSDDKKSTDSNYGTWVDVSAPGNNIYSTNYGNTYAYMSGTSMASPCVAGMAGLMLSLNPSLTQTDIINCIKNNTDNINSLNPGYSGQLGTGRINAYKAMLCVSATLNYKPTPDFVANVTTVTAGGQVSFTDLSLYNPTTWTWTFTGGTPASYNGKTPPQITYSAAGTYTVKLSAGNANGTNTMTKTAYITVTAAAGCSGMNLPHPGNWAVTQYYVTGGTVGQNGWVNGLNANGDKQKAMYFDASSTPYTHLSKIWINFGKSYSSNPAKIVPVKIYDGTSGSPGALLGTANTTMGIIVANRQANYYTNVNFTPAITLPASKKIFVAIDLVNLCWTCTPKDTLSLVTNTSGQTVPSAMWEQKSDNLWYRYNTAGSWALDLSADMHPFLTTQPTVATFTSNLTSICQGNSISYNATGSTFQDTLLFVFPGGSPSYSNSITPSVIYNTPGTYKTKLYVIGGGCGMLDSLESTITIKPKPALSVSASVPTTCPNASTTLTASGGATSYAWSPPTSLSGTTGTTVTANPASTITYNVQGTGANGCVNNSTITINVNKTPVAQVSMSATSVCIGQSVTFDGSLSTNVTNFSWSFAGGSPTASTSVNPTINYSSAGTFLATLVAQNSCGTDNTFSQNITVGCVGIDEAFNSDVINSFYDNSTSRLNVLLPQAMINENLKLVVIDAIGKVVYTEGGLSRDRIVVNMEGYRDGVYLLQIQGQATNYNNKFLKN